MEPGRRVSDRSMTSLVLVGVWSERESSLPSVVVPNKAQRISSCILSCIIMKLPLAFPFLCGSAF